MSEPEEPDVWYADGLRFECSRCGDCCRGPGYVWVTSGEIDRLAAHHELTVEAFSRRYLRSVSGRTALIDNTEGDCVFWRDGCTVYPERPTQCRTFPFWDQNLARPESWARTVRVCPGSGEGRLYDFVEIERFRTGGGQTDEGRTAPGRDARDDSD